MLKKELLKIPLIKALADKERYWKSAFLYRYRYKDTIEKTFEQRCGYKLNLDNPKAYNEKIQYLKIHWHDDLAVRCADKYEVRKYVEQSGYGDCLIPLIGLYKREKDIDFDSLPEKFALKATHGSGMNIICADKRKLDRKSAKKKIRIWLKQNYAYSSGERIYHGVQHRIICEKLLENKDGSAPCDYKIYCFAGVPRCVMVASGRQAGKLCMDFFTPDWRRMPFKRHNPNSEIPPMKPEHLGDMLDMAAKLSAPFPHARIDLYYVNGKIYFGEITFFPATGMQPFDPFEYDLLFGSWLDLEKVKR